MRTGAEDGELGCGSSALANIPRIGSIRDTPDK